MNPSNQSVSFGPGGYGPPPGGYGPPGGGYGGPPGGGGYGGPPGGGGYGGPPPGGFGPPPGGFGGPPPGGFGGPPPGYPGMGGPPMGPMMGPAPSSGLAIASLVCGIVALPSVCCCGAFPIPLGIAAAVMGGIAMSKANSQPDMYGGKGMALGGLICGIIAVLVSIVFMAIYGMASLAQNYGG